MTRAQQRARVRSVTAWTAAGAVALTGVFSVKAARSHARTSTPAQPSTTTRDPAGGQDQTYTLQAPSEAPSASTGLPATGSGGS